MLTDEQIAERQLVTAANTHRGHVIHKRTDAIPAYRWGTRINGRIFTSFTLKNLKIIIDDLIAVGFTQEIK